MQDEGGPGVPSARDSRSATHAREALMREPPAPPSWARSVLVAVLVLIAGASGFRQSPKFAARTCSPRLSPELAPLNLLGFLIRP